MKKILLSITLLTISALTYSQEKIDWVNVDELYNSVSELENEGEYEKALEEIKKLPKNDSAYSSSLTSQAYFLINLDKYEEAIEVSERGLKSKYQPFYYYFMVNKIAGLLGLEKYDEAIIELDKAIKVYPKNYKLYHNKGLAYEGLKEYKKAADMFKKSITYNPFYAQSHLRLAILCYDEQLITQTMMCLDMYLLCNPDGSGSFSVLNSFNNMVKSKNTAVKHNGVTLSKDDETFEDIDLIINNYAALNNKYKIGNKIDIPIVKQNHAMLGQLDDYEGNGGFWDKNYVPFYKWVQENKLFNTFAYTMVYSIENEKYKGIVNKNISKIKDFLPRFKKEWSRIVGENSAIIDGKKTTVQYIYNNSKIQGLGVYKNNITIGKWQIFGSKGAMSSEGIFDEEGKKHGKWTWYKKGKIDEEGEYNHGVLMNEYFVYHSNGELNIRTHYKEGKLDGDYKKYNSYGAIIEYIHYAEGKYNGEYLEYHSLGDKFIEYKIPYVDGEINGKVKEYYASGQLKAEMTFKANKLEGANTSYYRDGKTDTKKQYKDGLLTGEYLEYHKNGSLYQQGNCVEGNYVGEWKTFYSDNTLATVTFYVKGKTDGNYQNFDRDGLLQYEYTYRKNEIIAYKFYNKKGEVIKEEKKKGGAFFYEGHAANGNITTEGEYDVSGGKEGEWKFYSDNHVLETLQQVKKGLLQEVTDYHENGNVKISYPYNNDTLEGYYTSYYSNKQLFQQGYYHKGNLSGEWLTYYKDGTLKRKDYYTNDKLYGYREYYAGNGKLVSKQFYYEDDLKHKIFYNMKGEVVEEVNYEHYGYDDVIEDFYVNGALNTSYKMRYNIRHGAFMSNYFGGNVYCNGTYFNGKENGYWKWYHENGKLYKEGLYIHGRKDAVWKTYHKNGQLNKETTYLMGSNTGLEKTYNEGGVLIQTREHKNNKEHGAVKFYGEKEGKLQLIRYYNYGALIGYSYLDKDGKEIPMIPVTNETIKIKAFYDNGKPSRQMEIRNGNFINAYKEYYYSGQLCEDQNYEDDERKGVIKFYYPDGSLKTEKEYLLGSVIGVVKEYYPNGKLKEELEYANNERNGTSKFYDETGKLLKEKTYFDGEVFSEKTYK